MYDVTNLVSRMKIPIMDMQPYDVIVIGGGPAGSTAELEWELEIQGHKDGMMTLSAMVAWPTGRNWVRADRFGERRKAFSRCLCRGGSIEAGTRKQ